MNNMDLLGIATSPSSATTAAATASSTSASDMLNAFPSSPASSVVQQQNLLESFDTPTPASATSNPTMDLLAAMGDLSVAPASSSAQNRGAQPPPAPLPAATDGFRSAANSMMAAHRISMMGQSPSMHRRADAAKQYQRQQQMQQQSQFASIDPFGSNPDPFKSGISGIDPFNGEQQQQRHPSLPPSSFSPSTNTGGGFDLQSPNPAGFSPHQMTPTKTHAPSGSLNSSAYYGKSPF
jgi:hypothetical protein